MQLDFKVGVFTIFCCLTIGCFNSNGNKANNVSHFDTLPEKNVIIALDTSNQYSKSIRTIHDSSAFDKYDFYQFENDTLILSAYIYYVTPRNIEFILKTINKKELDTCEYSDTAAMANSGDGTAQGSDELNDDELYGEYEYFTNKAPLYCSIGIEFKRGNRLKVYTVNGSSLCKINCPLSGSETLRRRSLSKMVQHNPTW